MAEAKLEIPQLFRAPISADTGGSAGGMSEWPSSYKPTTPPNPPMNKVISSTGGHSIQLDSNPEARRVSIIHATGSHVEMYPDGRVKYKSVGARQDVTIGNSEMIVQGDFNITVDGGTRILVRNGALEIQADAGAAINVKGELKLNADNILMRAKEKITLAAPFVDIGGTPKAPYIRVPYSVVPVFGVPCVVQYGLPVPSSLRGETITPPTGGTGPSEIAGTVTGLVSTVAKVAKQIASIKQYAALGIGAGVSVVKLIKNTDGTPAVPELSQPAEIPLSNPKLYTGTTVNSTRLRDRQFDSPDDVDDPEAYTAHLNLCTTLGDIVESDKDLPGQLVLSDVDALGEPVPPAPEPLPARAFSLSGKVSCVQANSTVVGAGTKFTEDLENGQTIVIAGAPVKIGSILDDTTLLLAEPWRTLSVSAQTPYVYRLRSFQEFFGKYKYPLTTMLGTSSITLQHFMRNFIPPTIEKNTSSVAVPATTMPPTTTVDTGEPVSTPWIPPTDREVPSV